MSEEYAELRARLNLCANKDRNVSRGLVYREAVFAIADLEIRLKVAEKKMDMAIDAIQALSEKVLAISCAHDAAILMNPYQSLEGERRSKSHER